MSSILRPFHVDNIHPGGGTYYGYGIRFAKELFVASNNDILNEQASDRLKVFIFLSDGEPSDSGRNIFTSLKDLVVNVPDVITLVYGLDIDNAILRDIASHNYGKYGVTAPHFAPVEGQFEMLNPYNIRIKLGTFYAHPSIMAGSTSNVQWQVIKFEFIVNTAV